MTTAPVALPTEPSHIDVLRAIELRVLWLSTAMVHHANKVRTDPSGLKVGGHQASSASMVTRMPAAHLGVSTFGQSGDLASVYRYHGIDAAAIVAAAIVAAALDLVD
jgi:pyruvate dehydrogenase complex dehydrogenase (E1) component